MKIAKFKHVADTGGVSIFSKSFREPIELRHLFVSDNGYSGIDWAARIELHGNGRGPSPVLSVEFGDLARSGRLGEWIPWVGSPVLKPLPVGPNLETTIVIWNTSSDRICGHHLSVAVSYKAIDSDTEARIQGGLDYAARGDAEGSSRRERIRRAKMPGDVEQEEEGP